jgi:hypothetical protein
MYAIAVALGCCVFVAVGLVVAALDDRRRRAEFQLVEARAQASEALSRVRHPSNAHPFVPPRAPRHLKLVRGQR